MTMATDSGHDATPAWRRPWLSAFGLATVVFLSGAVVGAAVASSLMWRHSLDSIRRPRLDPDRIVEQMREDLGLTPEQEGAIRQVFVEHERKMAEFRAEGFEKMRILLEETQAAIEAVLTPEQAERSRERFNRLRERILPHAPGHSDTPGDTPPAP
ncbi:MAG: hypothetical protein JXR94_10235 [Candidatus Hydrogenedentes bacterium]|nr:hypothetical protein [Candidatus Hydrogenedentota bacterium]